jgi:hypothetical protein
MIGMQLGCGLFAPTSAGIGLAEPDFPVGSVARLESPYKDYTGQEVVETYTKMPNGNWSSGAKHNEYATSFEKLNFKHPVAIVLYGGVELYPVDRRAPVAQPMIDDIVIPSQPSPMLPNPNDAALEAAPWSAPKPQYGAPPVRHTTVTEDPGYVDVPVRQTAPAPAPAKSNNGLLAVLGVLAFVFLR